MAHLLTVLRDPALRAAALLSFLLGALVCSVGPFVSILAVHTFGLGDRGYAAVLVFSTGLSVAASVWVGIRADQTMNRRGLALLALALQAAGLALLVVAPGPVSFLAFHCLLGPLGSTVFGQIFALARLAASTHPPEVRDGVLTVVRAIFAAPFVLVLPLWSVAFRQGVDLLAVYPASLVMAVTMLAVTLFAWPRDGATTWQDARSGLSFRAALREIANPGLMARVAALGAINGMTTIYVALIGLLLVPAIGRGPQDVALYFGIVAGLEVPFMLATPLAGRWLPRTWLILAGTALYALHVLLMPMAAPHSWLWLLMLPAAAGGAVILTVPIAYLQDLLASRPGTGASLMALQRLAGDVMAAACFAIGTAISGYALVAILSVTLGLLGAVALVIWDGEVRRR